MNNTWNFGIPNFQTSQSRVSRTFKIMNFTAFPFYCADGSSGDPIELVPLIGTAGVPTNIPPDMVGKIIICRSAMEECPNGVITQVDDFWIPLATPPGGINQAAERALWYKEIPSFNMVLFGARDAAVEFKNKYHTLYNYELATKYGTQFINTVNYGIMNCTGKTLYQVDDTSFKDLGRADIIELPSAGDAMIQQFDQQKLNTMYNVRPSMPYIRAFRYGMIEENASTHTGYMREQILYWDKDTVGENGFMYIPGYQICIFETRDDAIAFINTYGSVEGYQRYILSEELRDGIQKEIDERAKEINRKNRRIVKACGIILSLNIATKLGEVAWNAMAMNKDKRESKNTGNIPGTSGAYHNKLYPLGWR